MSLCTNALIGTLYPFTAIDYFESSPSFIEFNWNFIGFLSCDLFFVVDLPLSLLSCRLTLTFYSSSSSLNATFFLEIPVLNSRNVFLSFPPPSVVSRSISRSLFLFSQLFTSFGHTQLNRSHDCPLPAHNSYGIWMLFDTHLAILLRLNCWLHLSLSLSSS